MAREKISDALAERVRMRARYRCEYCQRRLTGQVGELEHIVPVDAAGPSTFTNLALACRRCNGNKRNQSYGHDPVTGRRVKLFHPRHHRWEAHFITARPHVLGRTPVGRATATLLFRKQNSFHADDLGWRFLYEVRHQDTYDYLNRLRGFRLANRFRKVEDMVRQYNSRILQTPKEDLRVVRWVSLLLLAECYYTRSISDDVIKGLRLINELKCLAATAEEVREAGIVEYVLLKQAILRFRDSDKLRRSYTAMYFEALKEFTKAFAVDTVLTNLRWRADAARFGSPLNAVVSANDVRIAFDADHSGRELMYVSDIELTLSKPSRFGEALLDELDCRIQLSGYGQDADFARAILMRRRWWMLNFHTGQRIRWRLLERDIRLWKAVEMYHEVRELGDFGKTRLRKTEHALKLQKLLSRVMADGTRT